MDDNEDKQSSWSVNLKRYLLTLIVIWTLGVGFSLGWNIYQLKQSIINLAWTSARTTYEKDILYRRWAAMKGGVYAAPFGGNPFQSTSPGPQPRC